MNLIEMNQFKLRILTGLKFQIRFFEAKCWTLDTEGFKVRTFRAITVSCYWSSKPSKSNYFFYNIIYLYVIFEICFWSNRKRSHIMIFHRRRIHAIVYIETAGRKRKVNAIVPVVVTNMNVFSLPSSLFYLRKRMLIVILPLIIYVIFSLFFILILTFHGIIFASLFD